MVVTSIDHILSLTNLRYFHLTSNGFTNQKKKKQTYKQFMMFIYIRKLLFQMALI